MDSGVLWNQPKLLSKHHGSRIDRGFWEVLGGLWAGEGARLGWLGVRRTRETVQRSGDNQKSGFLRPECGLWTEFGGKRELGWL